MPTATVAVTGTSWTESTVVQGEGPHAVAHAVFTTEYAGDITATSTCGLLIAYVAGDPSDPHTLRGPYSGFEYVTGSVAGRTGTFVLAANGTHDGSVAVTTVQVVDGSGTGELTGLRGRGRYAADAMTYTLTLDYEFG